MEAKMLRFDINIVQLLVIALANFFLGWLWYSPLLFAKPWSKALGMDMSKPMSEEAKKKMPLLFGGAIVSSFALSFALQVLVHSLGAQDFASGALLGGLLWLGVSLPVLLGTLWEGRKGLVVAINLGNYGVSAIVFSGILAAWH
jgi:hypothetical protein